MWRHLSSISLGYNFRKKWSIYEPPLLKYLKTLNKNWNTNVSDAKWYSCARNWIILKVHPPPLPFQPNMTLVYNLHWPILFGKYKCLPLKDEMLTILRCALFLLQEAHKSNMSLGNFFFQHRKFDTDPLLASLLALFLFHYIIKLSSSTFYQIFTQKN